MALAYLLNQIPRIDPNIRIKPTAFIVNHNARPGSGSEAEFVGRQLRTHGKASKVKKVVFTDMDIDIESQILHMRWPEGIDPVTLPDFEMMARSSRYQLIAKAALRGQIRHLFLGHHLDDQIETIIMRLVRNTSFSFLGLKGMAAQSKIPCCESIRGANESIKFRSIEEYVLQDQAPGQERWWRPSEINNGRLVGVSESHGLQLHRPLLGFSKSQLIDTCQQYKVQYVSDKTNFDPTLTMRNAIRHMRANHDLPRAMQASSMLSLVGSARRKALSLESRGSALASNIQVVELDLRVGSMTIKLPQVFAALCKDDIEATSHALSRLTSVISPQPRDETPSLVPQARCLEFINALSSTGKAKPLQVQRTQMEKLPNNPEMAPGQSIWKLSRPPMRDAEVNAAEQQFDHPSTEPEDKSTGTWSKWILWDHRYWIRVKSENPTEIRNIAVRNFQEADLKDIQKALSTWKDFKTKLTEFAPGKMRWTLPVLTFANDISVFPTLNVRIQKPNGANGNIETPLTHHPILEWEVCYKIIDQAFIQDQKTKITWKNAQIAFNSMRHGT
jgi:tRNA(Ile)-lysidine synthase